MRFFRSQRVEKLIHVELAKIVIREMDFSDTLVTITEVTVGKKMDHAEVEVAVIPSEAGPRVLKEFKKAEGHLQYLLTHKLNIKPMPRISFALDHGTENAASVEKVLLKK